MAVAESVISSKRPSGTAKARCGLSTCSKFAESGSFILVSKPIAQSIRSQAAPVLIVNVDAGRDILLRGANVVSDTGTRLQAANNITIEAAQNTASTSSFIDTRQSGLMGSGGVGVFIGNRQQSTSTNTQQTTAAGSTVGSISGNVTVVAGNQYRQVGSDVMVPRGDVTIVGKDVAIIDAQNTFAQQTETKTRQTGITASINSPILSAVQTVQSTAQAIGQTKDSRMQALGRNWG